MVKTSLLAVAAGLTALFPTSAWAASSKFCEGGSFTVLGKTGTKDDRFRGNVPAPSSVFKVQGQFVEFFIDPDTFAVLDQAWTGKANVGDMTGGRHTVVYASRVPDHRGATLTSDISLEIREEVLKISRSGPGITMSIQAKDCAQGGIFQMEPERADNTSTRIIHTLAEPVFQYDNPNFRENLGKFLGSGCTSEATGPPSDTCVRVTPRVNIGRDDRPDLVLRDSAQVATRIRQAECGPDFTNPLGLSETRDYCGRMTIWDVASGGRMGMVTGEDSTEVANPPTNCVSDCQAENQVNGKLAVLDFPFPVPAEVRLSPALSEDGLDAPLVQH